MEYAAWARDMCRLERFIVGVTEYVSGSSLARKTRFRDLLRRVLVNRNACGEATIEPEGQRAYLAIQPESLDEEGIYICFMPVECPRKEMNVALSFSFIFPVGGRGLSLMSPTLTLLEEMLFL